MMNKLVRWNPVREMAAMQSALDRLFDETWRPLFDDERLRGFALAIDVHEDDKGYTVTTDLPGVEPENINVHLDGEYLVVEAEIPEQVIEKKEARTLIKERCYGKFSRRVQLPQPVEADKVEAAFENGVLTLTLPKSPEVQPKMITVKSGKKK
jgi:HSP20 family protein